MHIVSFLSLSHQAAPYYIEPTDKVVSSICSHSFHRDCITGWVEMGKKDCPYCRQEMWPSKVYDEIKQDLKEATLSQQEQPATVNCDW